MDGWIEWPGGVFEACLAATVMAVQMFPPGMKIQYCHSGVGSRRDSEPPGPLQTGHTSADWVLAVVQSLAPSRPSEAQSSDSFFPTTGPVDQRERKSVAPCPDPPCPGRKQARCRAQPECAARLSGSFAADQLQVNG